MHGNRLVIWRIFACPEHTRTIRVDARPITIIYKNVSDHEGRSPRGPPDSSKTETPENYSRPRPHLQ